MTRSIPLAQRRIGVVIQLLSYPLVYFLAVLAGLWPSIAGLLGLAALAGSSVYLYKGTGLWQFGNAPDDQLDERQMQIRNQAYRYAYMGVSALIVVSMLFLLVSEELKWRITIGYDQINLLFWTVWTIVMTLPSSILAWTEPEV